MSGCEYYQELISRMLDEDLSRDERAALTEHLGTCRECAAMYQAFSALSDTISSDLAEPPEELCDNIMAELRRSEIIRRNRKTGLSRQMKNLIAAAACAALVIAAVGGVAIVNGRRTDNAVYESRTSLKTSGDIYAAGEERSSIEAPTPTPAPAAADIPAVQSDGGVSGAIPDIVNYGYVPATETSVPSVSAAAPAQFPDFYPSATAAPTAVPTRAPTAAPTPVPTPVPTLAPSTAPTAEPEKSLEQNDAQANEQTDETLGSAGLLQAPAEVTATPTETPAETAAPEHAAPPAAEEPPCVLPEASDDESENIVRLINMGSTDVTALVEKLLTNREETDAAAAAPAEETAAPVVSPSAPPTAAEKPVTETPPTPSVPPVVSSPVPVDEHLRALLPEGVEPVGIDIIEYTVHDTQRSTEHAEVNKLIVCIADDGILVLAHDDDGKLVRYTPALTADDYAALVEPFVTLAKEAADNMINP